MQSVISVFWLLTTRWFFLTPILVIIIVIIIITAKIHWALVAFQTTNRLSHLILPTTWVCLTSRRMIFLLYPQASQHTGMGVLWFKKGLHGLDLFGLADSDSPFFQTSQRPFIHSATIYLLSTHCVPGTMLDSRDTGGASRINAPAQSSWPGQGGRYRITIASVSKSSPCSSS